MTQLLLTAHAPTPNTSRLLDAARAAIAKQGPSITLVEKPPLDVTSQDLLAADGLLLGTLENIGAMAGLTKDMFDRCYNDWLDKKPGLPVAVWIRAGLDGTATRRQAEAIISAQKWRLVAAPLVLTGQWQDGFCDETAALAGGLAAGLDAGIF